MFGLISNEVTRYGKKKVREVRIAGVLVYSCENEDEDIER